MDLGARIEGVLARIHDPCSVAAGRPASILAMGLVLGWDESRGVVTLRLTVTNTGCTMFPHFSEAARRAIEALPGVDRCTVEVDLAYQWTPERMSGVEPLALPGAAERPQPRAWRQRPAGASSPR